MTHKTHLFFYFMLIFCLTALAFAHGWKAPEKKTNKKNPLKSDKIIIAKGGDLYTDFCMDCHGHDAKGKTAVDAGLETAPPDLRKRLEYHSQGDIFWKIQTGRNEMPSFKDDLSEEEIWQIILYIRSL